MIGKLIAEDDYVLYHHMWFDMKGTGCVFDLVKVTLSVPKNTENAIGELMLLRNEELNKRLKAVRW